MDTSQLFADQLEKTAILGCHEYIKNRLEPGSSNSQALVEMAVTLLRPRFEVLMEPPTKEVALAAISLLVAHVMIEEMIIQQIPMEPLEGGGAMGSLTMDEYRTRVTLVVQSMPVNELTPIAEEVVARCLPS